METPLNNGSPRLPADTGIGRVHLQVGDLERALDFYSELVGLEVLQRWELGATLGVAGGPELVRLTELPGAAPCPPRSIGLYHFAILFPHRGALAHAFLRLYRAGWRFQGFSDHEVSEAIYLADPDGNGLEIYADRPRDSWVWHGSQVYMSTKPLDLENLVQAAKDYPDEGRAPAGTRVGHIHLHVGDLERAATFYEDLLGFDVVNRSYPGALFLSAGRYHHHVALNTWAGPRALRPGPDVAGLLDFEVLLSSQEAAMAVVERFHRAQWPVEEEEAGARWRMDDPDGNRVFVQLRSL